VYRNHHKAQNISGFLAERFQIMNTPTILARFFDELEKLSGKNNESQLQL